MPKYIPNTVLDAMLTAAEGDSLVVCSAQPTNYLEATQTYKLAQATLGPNDFVKANGDVSGRKNTVAAKVGIPIETSGVATHVAIVSTANSALRRVTTCNPQGLTAGGTVDVSAHKHELNNPQ